MSKMADKHAERLDAPDADEKRLVVEGVGTILFAGTPPRWWMRTYEKYGKTHESELDEADTQFIASALHDARQESRTLITTLDEVVTLVERLRLRPFSGKDLSVLTSARATITAYRQAHDKEAPGE